MEIRAAVSFAVFAALPLAEWGVEKFAFFWARATGSSQPAPAVPRSHDARFAGDDIPVTGVAGVRVGAGGRSPRRSSPSSRRHQRRRGRGSRGGLQS